MSSTRLASALLLCSTLWSGHALAWGHRGHVAIDTAAVQALPDDGPAFLKRYQQVIADGSTIPDDWRGESEPFLKIEEDPNHGWFREQFAFMKAPPRSRYAFVLALYDERRRIERTDPELARRMNVRWTGTLPYAAVEGYERLVVTMRQIRAMRAHGQDSSELERTCAFYVSWFGHYIGDGANPMHDSIHHNGWSGPNPHGYSRDPQVHGKFESAFVDKMSLTGEMLASHMAPLAHQQGDVFELILAYLDKGTGRVEWLYRLEKDGAFDDAARQDGRDAVFSTAGDGASMLRDLLVRAWRESALKPERSGLPPTMDPSHPHYDPRTGSAPASTSPVLSDD